MKTDIEVVMQGLKAATKYSGSETVKEVARSLLQFIAAAKANDEEQDRILEQEYYDSFSYYNKPYGK